MDEREQIERLWMQVRALHNRIDVLVRAYEARTGRSPYHETGGLVGETWDSKSGQWLKL